VNNINKFKRIFYYIWHTLSQLIRFTKNVKLAFLVFKLGAHRGQTDRQTWMGKTLNAAYSDGRMMMK